MPRIPHLPHQLARLFGSPLRWLLGLFHSTVHGDARWMSWYEKRAFLSPRNKGIVLSPKQRLSQTESFKNLCLVAPTGSGKTSKYVIPNVLEVEGSVVITDPSGEIFEKTSGHLKDRGFLIQALQPADLDRSLRFNPLSYSSTPQELRYLATVLANNSSSQHSDPFWTVSAVNVLYLVLSALVNVEDPCYVNLPNLRWLLNHMGGEESTAMHYFMARYLEHQAPQMFSEYVAFCATEPRVRASILSTARSALELWSDPQVCRFSATNSVDIEALRRRPSAIYVIVPEHRMRYLSLLANLFYSTCFTHCLRDVGREDVQPVFFLLDEFGNLGRVENMASFITTLRKRRCSISLILQDLSQLDAVYGREEAQTIFSGGCANKLFFSGLDLETTEYLERLLGNNTEYDTTFGGIDERAGTLAVPLMRLDQIRMLDDSEGILISGRQRPAKLKMPAYFLSRRLRRLTSKSSAPLNLDYSTEKVRYLDLGGNQDGLSRSP